MTAIKKGYRVSIETWENDGDHYNTKVIEGLSKEAAQFLVDFSKFFYSQSSRKNGSINFGNMYEPSDEEFDELVEHVGPLIIRNFDILKEFGYSYLDKNDRGECVLDIISDLLLDTQGSSEDFWSRVTSSIKVEYIPVDVELDDVSKEFGV